MTIKNNSGNDLHWDDSSEFIKWEECLSTGITHIDSQHLELIQIINRLKNACMNGTGTVDPVFKEALSRMVEYVRFHFTAELEMLKRINYPNFDEHKKQHDTLVRDILAAANEYKEGKRFIPLRFIRTLKDWVLSHIAVFDRMYSDYIADQKKKGLLSDQQLTG